MAEQVFCRNCGKEIRFTKYGVRKWTHVQASDCAKAEPAIRPGL